MAGSVQEHRVSDPQPIRRDQQLADSKATILSQPELRELRYNRDIEEFIMSRALELKAESAYSLDKLVFLAMIWVSILLENFLVYSDLEIRPALSLEAATSLVPPLGGLTECTFDFKSKGKYYRISKRI